MDLYISNIHHDTHTHTHTPTSMKKSDCNDLTVKQLKDELRDRKKNNRSLRIKLTVNKEELCKQVFPSETRRSSGPPRPPPSPPPPLNKSQHIEVDATVPFAKAMIDASPDMKLKELRYLKKKINQLIDEEIAKRKKPYFY